MTALIAEQADVKEKEIQAKVTEFLAKHIGDTQLHPSENLFKGGYVNSLFVMQLLTFVEKTFSIKVEDDDLELSNFCSIEAVTGFVVQKLAN